jgi:hypothetical protein
VVLLLRIFKKGHPWNIEFSCEFLFLWAPILLYHRKYSFSREKTTGSILGRFQTNWKFAGFRNIGEKFKLRN